MDKILKIIRCHSKSTSQYTCGTKSCACKSNGSKRTTVSGDRKGFGCNNQNLFESEDNETASSSQEQNDVITVDNVQKYIWRVLVYFIQKQLSVVVYETAVLKMFGKFSRKTYVTQSFFSKIAG